MNLNRGLDTIDDALEQKVAEIAQAQADFATRRTRFSTRYVGGQYFGTGHDAAHTSFPESEDPIWEDADVGTGPGSLLIRWGVEQGTTLPTYVEHDSDPATPVDAITAKDSNIGGEFHTAVEIVTPGVYLVEATVWIYTSGWTNVVAALRLDRRTSSSDAWVIEAVHQGRRQVGNTLSTAEREISKIQRDLAAGEQIRASVHCQIGWNATLHIARAHIDLYRHVLIS